MGGQSSLTVFFLLLTKKVNVYKHLIHDYFMVGEAIGTGARGGVLVTTDKKGGVKETFQNRVGELADPGRKSFVLKGVTKPSETILKQSLLPSIRSKTVAEIQRIRSSKPTVSQGFLQRNLNIIQKNIQKLERQKERKQSFAISKKIIDLEREKRQIKSSLTSLALVGTGVVKSIFTNAQGFNELRKNAPLIFQTLRQNPSKALKIPGIIARGLKEEGKEIVALYQVSPQLAVGRVAGELVSFGGTGKILKAGVKIPKATFNKIANLNPRLLKVKAGVIDLNKKQKGLTVKVGSITDIKESVSKQLTREGKKVTAITAQASKIVGFIKRKNIIRKPIPGETDLTKTTKILLSKFDKGKLSAKQVLELNKRIRKETTGKVQQKGVDLLERSTFFDPNKVLRKSRLAIKDEVIPEGTFFDLIRGRASIFQKKAKPQILLVEEFVEKLPRTKEFASIRTKIARSRVAGKDPNLTADELARLSRFQVTPSGKLKPIGSTTFQGGLEREVTIAPKEIIKRVKKLGTLKVGNKRVPIIAVKIVKGKENVGIIKRVQKITGEIKKLTLKKNKTKNPRIKKQLENKIKSNNKKLNKIKTKTASKEVKEFLRDRRIAKRKKVFPIKRKGLQAVSRTKIKPRKKATPRKITPRKAPGKIKPVKPRLTPRPSAKARPRKTSRPGVRAGMPPKKPTKKKIKFKGKKQRIKKPTAKTFQGYNALAKSKKKFVKLNTKPLSRKGALNRASYVVEHSVSARGKIKPIGKVKKLGKVTKKEQGSFNRNKNKVRGFRIVKGKRRTIKSSFIEKKGKPRINTRGEKKGLTVAKLKKQLIKPRVKRNAKKKKTK